MQKGWTFKSSFTIPRTHIAGAQQDVAAAHALGGFRALGTSVPWVIKAGTFYLHGQSCLQPTFVDVAHSEQTAIIDLHDGNYQ